MPVFDQRCAVRSLALVVSRQLPVCAAQPV